ncbi:hypothetical protein ACER0A_009415 [Haloimpatiens sp. FM7315]|uniref:hypothetical protein n=1 Tax=Haloimpatiens sp. FM7315 TaxID=3298609 RepID=UPI003977B6E8
MIKEFDNYNSDYTYKKKDIDIQMSKLGYNMVERTNNGLLYPEGIKDEIDMPEFR